MTHTVTQPPIAIPATVKLLVTLSSGKTISLECPNPTLWSELNELGARIIDASLAIRPVNATEKKP